MSKVTYKTAFIAPIMALSLCSIPIGEFSIFLCRQVNWTPSTFSVQNHEHDCPASLQNNDSISILHKLMKAYFVAQSVLTTITWSERTKKIPCWNPTCCVNAPPADAPTKLPRDIIENHMPLTKPYVPTSSGKPRALQLVINLLVNIQHVSYITAALFSQSLTLHLWGLVRNQKQMKLLDRGRR